MNRRGEEYAPTVIDSSGKGKSNAGSEFDRLQAEKTHLRQQVDSLQRQLAEKSKVADSEQQQKWKAQEDLRLKEIAEATKKLDAVTQSKVELEELLKAANAELKEAKAKLSPKEFGLRLVRGGDEEQGKDVSPGTLSARFLDRCQDYAGKTSDIHGLTSPGVAGGYNTRTWEGEFSMEREGNKHCLVLTESFADGRPAEEYCRTFLYPKALDGLPLEAVYRRPCPPQKAVRFAYMFGESAANDAESKAIENDLRKLLPPNQLVGANSTGLWTPEYKAFVEKLGKAKASHEKWGGGNYEFLDLKEDPGLSATTLTLVFKPLLKKLGDIAFEFAHSGGAPEQNCVARLVVPASRRGASQAWSELAKNTNVFDDDRIKLVFVRSDGKYRPSSKAAALQVTLNGMEPLSLAFEKSDPDSPAPNCVAGGEGKTGPIISDDELSKVLISRTVRNVRRPFITIVTLDGRWQGLGTEKDKYQVFWDRALRMADKVAADKGWELAASTRLQFGFANAGEPRKLEGSGDNATLFSNRASYVERLVQEFDQPGNSTNVKPFGQSVIDQALEKIFEYEGVKVYFGADGPKQTPAAILVLGAAASTEASDFCNASAFGFQGLSPRWFMRGDKILAVELWGEGAKNWMVQNHLAAPTNDSEYLYSCTAPTSDKSNRGEMKVYGLVLPNALQKASADKIFSTLTAEAGAFLKK